MLFALSKADPTLCCLKHHKHEIGEDRSLALLLLAALFLASGVS